MTVKKLVEEYEDKIQQAEAKAATDRGHAIQKTKAYWESILGKELVEELQMQTESTKVGGVSVIFHYQGTRLNFRGGDLDTIGVEEIRSNLAQWTMETDGDMIGTDSKRHEAKLKWLQNLRNDRLSGIDTPSYIGRRLKEMGLDDDPEIDEAFQQWMDRRKGRSVTRAGRNLEEIRQNVARSSIAEEDNLDQLNHWVTSAREQATHPDYHLTVNVIERAKTKLVERGEEKKRKLEEAQVAAWYPWRYYIITYATMQPSTEGWDGVKWFISLKLEPEEDGFYHPVQQDEPWERYDPIKPTWVTSVERVTAQEPSDVRHLNLESDTEWGTILVPPAGAERVVDVTNSTIFPTQEEGNVPK